MKYLFKKIVRDVRKLWPQFVSVFMMAFLAMTIYSGMEGVWYGLSEASREYFKDTRLCDVWVYANGITEEQFRQIASLDSVKALSRSMTVTADADTAEASDIRIIALNDGKTMKPLIRSGKEYSCDSKGIWIDESYAGANHLNAGDTVAVTVNGVRKSLPIQGTILHSEFIFYTGPANDTLPDPKKHGYGIISEKQASLLYGGLIFNEIRLSLPENCDTKALKEEVKDILKDSYTAFMERKDKTSVSQIDKEINQMKTLSKAYCSIFILLAVLTMYTTMKRLVENQRIIIGTLMALGYNNMRIRFHYALYGAVVSLFGGLAGSIAGRNTVSRAIMDMKKITLTLPVWEIRVSSMTYILIGLTMLVCTLSAVMAAGKSLKEMPALTMRGVSSAAKSGKAPGRHRVSGLSNEWRWVLRDIGRNRIRFLMGIIGITGSMTLMIAAFGVKNSIDYTNHYIYGSQYTYQYKAELTNYNKEVKKKLETEANNLEWMYETTGTMELKEKADTGVITVLSPGNFVTLRNRNGGSLALPDNGVLMTQVTAKSLGVKAEDTITVTIAGSRNHLKVKIKEIIDIPAPQGIFLSQKAWESCGSVFYPNYALLGNDTENTVSGQQEYFGNVIRIEDQLKDIQTMSNSVMTIVILLIAASLLLGFVILYNLGLLNFIERFREYATMKVLGFYQKEIRNMGIKDCILTALPGWAAGTVCGFAFLRYLISLVSLKNYVWIPHLTVISYLIITSVCYGISFGINLLISRRVNKIDMAEALKSVE